MKRHLVTLLAAALTAATINPAAADQSPKTRATAGGTLTLDTRLSHGWLSLTEPTTLYASVSIKARDAAETTDRAPLNIALVVDRSTSMSGGKLEKAKGAGHLLVDMLGPQDRLAIVSYGSDVSTMSESLRATAANKELLHNAIRNIQLRGSTNLSGGYERGRDLIAPHNRDDTINRVILLSDGHANVGLTDARSLGPLAARGLDRGISLTTMGIGLDYNEELMTRMAKEGAGNYYFIEKEEAIATMFETECKGLTSTVARETVLTLEVAPGVELLEVPGFAHKTKGDKTTIKLSEFFARQQKDILVKLAASPQTPGGLPILTTRLDFDDVLQDNRRVHSKVTVYAAATKDKKRLTQVEGDVIRRAQQVQTAEAMRTAMVEYERGERAKAAAIVARQRQANQAFQKTYGFEDDADFARVNGELQTMEEDVKTTAPASVEGKRLRKTKKERAYKIDSAASGF